MYYNLRIESKINEPHTNFHYFQIKSNQQYQHLSNRQYQHISNQPPPAMEATLILQYSTSTPLAASSDDGTSAPLLSVKRQLRQIHATICTPGKPTQGTVNAPPYTIHYTTDEPNDVMAAVITSESFPVQLAASYLAEIHDEFVHMHATDIRAAANRSETIRPYQYMSFETFIAKTMRVYADARATDGLADVAGQLRDVQAVMHSNIADLLNRGEELSTLHDLSSNLREQSIKYKKYAKKINWDLFIKKYSPLAVVALILLLVVYRWVF